jgi:hypothetical protein
MMGADGKAKKKGGNGMRPKVCRLEGGKIHEKRASGWERRHLAGRWHFRTAKPAGKMPALPAARAFFVNLTPLRTASG